MGPSARNLLEMQGLPMVTHQNDLPSVEPNYDSQLDFLKKKNLTPFQMYQFKGERECLPQHVPSVERLDPIHFRKML